MDLLELINIALFYIFTPKDEVIPEDPHKRMLARLDWELKERRRYLEALYNN